MWEYLWYALYAILAIVAIVLYFFYSRYKKYVKPEKIAGIPSPPLQHAQFGHPDLMLHPYRHELRLNVSEAAGAAPLHQLSLMKHNSVFINSSKECANVLRDFPIKGMIYAGYRFDPTVPDIYASDGDEFTTRKKALVPALENMKLKDKRHIAELMSVLNAHAESGKPINVKEFFSYLAFDIVCESAFNYDLGAIAGTSIEGRELYQSLCTLTDAQATSGIYAIYDNPNARKVGKEELDNAKSTWRKFIEKIQGYIRSSAEQYKAMNGELDSANNFAHALIKLSEDESKNINYGEKEIISEIHQILRHGHECVATMLCWLFYALHSNPAVRVEAEKSVKAHTPTAAEPYPEYLECTIKETLRRYIATGVCVCLSVFPSVYVLLLSHNISQLFPQR